MRGMEEQGEEHGVEHGGLHYHWLYLMSMIGNLKFEAYYEMLYTFWVNDSLRTSKVHHCLSLANIGCK